MSSKIACVLIASLVLMVVAVPSISADIPSPKQQIESGIPPEDVQCRENFVLVIRDNGKAACVTYATAEHKGWKTYEQRQNLQNAGTAYSAPSLGNYANFTISNFPRLGETATLTLTTTKLMPFDIDEDFSREGNIAFGFEIEDGFEFVGVTPTDRLDYHKPSKNAIYYQKYLVLPANTTTSMEVTIKAVKEGNHLITAHPGITNYVSLYLTVGKNETTIYEKPSLEDLNASGASTEPKLSKEERLALSIRNDANVESADVIETTYPTPEEYRQRLEKEGTMTQEEIDAEIKRYTEERAGDPDLDTQSSSFLPKAYASSSITGRGTIQITPSFADDTDDRASGINVCAVDRNSSTKGYDVIKNTKGKDGNSSSFRSVFALE